MRLPRVYNANALKKYKNENIGRHEDGRWLPVRPMSLHDVQLMRRLKAAWDVFTGKVDIIYWEIE